MERIVITHLSGSKASQVEKFSLDKFIELTFGRESSANVKFSEELEILVGRQHAKITRNPADPAQFLVSDINSRIGHAPQVDFEDKTNLELQKQVKTGAIRNLSPRLQQRSRTMPTIQ